MIKRTFYSRKPATWIRAGVLTFTFACCLFLFCYRNTIVESFAAGENDKIPASRSDFPIPWSLEGQYHERLAMALDIPSIQRSATHVLRPSIFPTSEIVVGIVHQDRAVAIPLRALASPSTHIMLFEIQGEPFAISHCDLTGCSRVFKGPNRTKSEPYGDYEALDVSSQAFDLRVGGMDENGEMVLLYNGTRYAQLSDEIPLDDHEFQITDLGKWMEMYPETVIVCPKGFEAHHTPVRHQQAIAD